MAGTSKIEWTEATWNPIVGCSIVSPGCTNCYAMKMAGRIERMSTAPHYDGTTQETKAGSVWTGKVAMAPDNILLQPLRRKKPTTYFVNSMGDLFHESVPDEWIDRVFAVMALCPQHTFQVLTKRAERMRDWVTDPDTSDGHINSYHRTLDIAEHMIGNDRLANFSVPRWPLPNVWLGVSAERQQEADERIPHLLDTPAAGRFVSCEPLLGPIDLSNVRYEPPRTLHALTGFKGFDEAGNRSSAPHLDWVIAGGESVRGARPMHPDWARGLRDQCAAAGVAYFFKQWGEWKPLDQISERVITGTRGPHAIVHRDGRFVKDSDIADPPRAVFTFNFGKKAAGRQLDGREHSEMPNAVR